MAVLTPRPIAEENEWNKALERIPNAHVLQTWEWGQVKSRHGWTPTRLLFEERGTPNAAAQILRRPLPRTPWAVLYVPKGPALNYSNSALTEDVLAMLEQFAREQKAIFIKVDPDIELHDPNAALFARRDWIKSNEQIQFRNTVTLDLSRNEEDLLGAMKSKWRYNIRLAERKGVIVEEGGANALESFYELYSETSARDGFLIRQFPYYRDVWSTMSNAGLAQFFFARVGAEIVAGLILFHFAGRAWYFYGASRNVWRELMPNHLLQWEAIRWAKAHGCTEYDFWGAPDRLVESDSMYGVYKFKLGFGGKTMEHIPAHDFVVNQALYYLYAVARPKYLARLKSKDRQRDGG